MADLEGILHVTPNEGKALGIMTDIVTFKVSGEDTHGAFALTETRVPPGGGPPMHRQSSQETFYILSGEFEFFGINEDSQEHSFKAGPGSSVHVVENAAHTYKNISATPGIMLVLFTPAGRTEEFFRRIGSELPDTSAFPAPMPLNMESLLPIMQEFQVEIVLT
jgi:quercetin dioxygenase-like cupin family protein